MLKRVAVLLGWILGSYFKRRPVIRMAQLQAHLASNPNQAEDLLPEEQVALLTILLARSGTDSALMRASQFPPGAFNVEFFRYMLQVFQDIRSLGLSREFQLRMMAAGENLARKHQLPEWADEFRTQRELIFNRHTRGIPVIRYPR